MWRKELISAKIMRFIVGRVHLITCISHQELRITGFWTKISPFLYYIITHSFLVKGHLLLSAPPHDWF